MKQIEDDLFCINAIYSLPSFLDEYRHRFTIRKVNRMLEYLEQQIGIEMEEFFKAQKLNPVGQFGIQNYSNNYYKLIDVKGTIKTWMQQQGLDQLKPGKTHNLNEASQQTQQMQQPLDQREPKPCNPFIDHLFILKKSKRKPFADKLKKEFPGIGGKELGILLKAIEAEGHICIIDRKRKVLYDSLRQFFGWDINSDESINRPMRHLKLYNNELQYYRGIIVNIYNSI